MSRPQLLRSRFQMSISLKPLDKQVIVITGASSGIGLATALAAAPTGRARSCSLRAASGPCDEIVAADHAPPAARRSPWPPTSAERDDVERLAEAAIERVRAHRHLGQRRRRLDLRPARRGQRRGQPAALRDQLLGRRLRLAGRAAAPAPERRRADQRRQRGVRRGRAAAGDVLGEQARGQGVHRRAAHRARGRQGAGLGHADPADRRRHALPRARRATT